jgi:hypothetical protein
LHIEIISNYFLPSSLESSITLKRKTLSGEDNISALPPNKRSKNIGFVPMRDHAKLVAQLATTDDQNQLYQTTWMRKYQSNFSFFSFNS